MKNLDNFKKQGTVKELIPQERKQYEQFLLRTYQENFKVSKQLLSISSRWSIIAGYYAMHDISKLLLAKNFNLKISQPSAHVGVIQAIKELINKEEIIILLEKAESEIETLHGALIEARSEREKSQYYHASNSLKNISKKANNFHKLIVEPFIKLVESLL